jgi:hypothetical protein
MAWQKINSFNMAKKKRSVKAKGRAKSRPRVKTKKKSTRKRVGAQRKPAKKRTAVKKRTLPRKRKAPRKRKQAAGRQLVKQVERSSVERVLAGKRKRRRSPKKRTVVMAGSRRRRKVGALGGNGMLVGLGIGALALYLLTKKSTYTPTPGTYQLPPLNTTNNYTRNTQSTDLINYAIAGGLAIDAIIKLIDRLNNSSDQEVTNIYDRVNTTGDFSTYV